MDKIFPTMNIVPRKLGITKCFFCILIVIVVISLSPKNFIQENVVLWNAKDNRIPLIVHFVIGQGDRKNVKHLFQLSTPFTMINYLTILAARRQIRPTKLYVHYYEEPTTFWWNQTKQDPEINITPLKSRLVDRIFNKSVDHHAHRGRISCD